MGPRLPLLLLCLTWGACTRGPGEDDARALWVTARDTLSRREGKLQDLHLAGTVTEGAHVARFRYWYRAPGKMRGELAGPAERTFAFDGKHLYETTAATRRHVRYALGLPKDQAALYLTQVFGPFVPEGYRAPLLPASASARRTSHPRAPEALELRARTQDEQGTPIELRYVYRWPAMELLEKRLSYRGLEKVTSVEAEWCDEGVGLCVPSRLVERTAGSDGAVQMGQVTQLQKVELRAGSPAERFVLVAPEGFEAKEERIGP